MALTRAELIAGGAEVTGEIKLLDSDRSNWVAFKSADSVSSNVTWTLPAADGASGETLSTDGNGTLSWSKGGGNALIFSMIF